jgi:hypothetical protein
MALQESPRLRETPEDSARLRETPEDSAKLRETPEDSARQSSNAGCKATGHGGLCDTVRRGTSTHLAIYVAEHNGT